jgi:hypothetical protein
MMFQGYPSLRGAGVCRKGKSNARSSKCVRYGRQNGVVDNSSGDVYLLAMEAGGEAGYRTMTKKCHY